MKSKYIQNLVLILNDSILFLLFSVFDRASKEGLKISKVKARAAVKNVVIFIKKAQEDELGSFSLKSSTSQPTARFMSEPPEFWKEILKHCDSRSDDGCLIVSLTEEKKRCLYKCDLLISSDDLNSCTFHKQLSRCLLKKKSVIYIDALKLTIRGHERALNILRDCKALFDDRVWLILLSGESDFMPVELAKISEIEFKH